MDGVERTAFVPMLAELSAPAPAQPGPREP